MIGGRAPSEIRASLWETQAKMDRDLSELETRLHESLSPKALLSRHPALFGIAGALLGVVLFRRPALLARGITWAARMSTPFLVRALLRKG
ncbi:MAG: hypothetical protein ACRD21_06020 [Vicinamibacteria bacterium]